MKRLSRDFTIREKILLLILALLLVGFAYYRFVDVPVREGIASAQSKQDSLSTELTIVEAKVRSLEKMQNELDDIAKQGTVSYMPSYNNAKNVNRLLNDVLGPLDYAVNFTQLTRTGNQIRRNVSLQFTSPDYETMETVLRELSESEYRCLLNDLKGSVNTLRDGGTITVNLTATFFETMVGGTEDAGLPADSAK